MIAGKHFDPILGLDVHIILIPTPAGPVPTPIPHPYVGFMLDPFDYLPFVGATVLVNGLPRAQAGSSGMEVPKHIPMGGMFQKPPTFESEMFMGSSSVQIDGEPFSYTALPVLSCQDIGLPAPRRPKKKNAAKSLMLPVTTLLAIPMGAPVMVGGAPTISMSAMAMKAGMAALGKGLKKLRKLQRSSRRMKAFSDKMHKKADALCDKLGLGDAARARVHKGVCTVTGHPVDVATGKVFTDAVDFELPGPIPFKLERTWYSTSTYRGPLGHGWHHSYDMALHVAEDMLLLRTADGRHVGLPRLSPNESYFEPRERLTLHCDGLDHYRVQAVDGLSYVFDTLPARHGRNQDHLSISDELRLTFIRDRSGHQIELERDGFGQLKRIIDSAGRVLTPEHDAEGRMRALRAPHPDRSGQSVTVAEYRYDQRGDLVECRDALGAATRFVYKDHLLVQETNRAGLSFYFTYDGKGAEAKCLRTWGDGGIYDHKLAYDPIAQITTVENSLGHKTLYQHDGGLVVRSVDPVGATTLTQYDEHGRLLSEVDPNGLTTKHVYDERGNLLRTTSPGGAKTVMTYDAEDQPLTATDALGGVWTYAYDERGRLVERSDPLGQRTRLWYTGGLLAGVTDPEDHATGLTHDAEHNVETVTTPDQAVTRFRCDGWGRMIERIDPKGNAQRRWYDLLGRAQRIEEPDGNVRTLRHDAEGRVIQLKDQQRDIELGYRGMGRLAYRSEAKTTVRFEYDTEEQLIGIQNEHGHVYRFELDARGLLQRESGFDGLRREYRHDLGGRVREVGRASGLRSKYSYDAASRLSKIEHSDGSGESYKFRMDGALIQASNADVSVRFERDALGRVLREGYGAHSVESSYARSGLRDSVRSSFGLAQGIQRNVMGDVVDVDAADGAFAAHFERDSLGHELSRSLPGGVRVRWQRDSLGRPLQHELSSAGQTLRARSYSWSFDHRLQQVIDAMRGPIHYGHDARGNLAQARHADGTLELRLPDAVGNLFKREDRGDRRYGPAGQLLEARGPEGITSYRYDPEGNLVEKEEPGQRLWRYAWSAAGALAKVTRPDGGEVSFTYDALGRRVSKSYDEKTTRWLWDGNLPLHEWVEAERPVTWLFEPETFAPLAKLVGEQRYAIVTDHLGTPVSMLDADGVQVWASEIDTYGVLHGLRGARDACPFRWPGQYEDGETGLYYNRFRYYDPDAGQYIAQDPIGLAGGAALYAYVQDPTLAYDPIGLAERLVRYTDEAEAKQSAGNMGGDNKLHPKMHGERESRGPKWVTEQGGERRVANKKVKMDIEVTDGTTAWLRSNGVDFEDVAGETAAPNKVLRKANEPGSHGVGRGLLDDLNSRITKITATTEGGGSRRRRGRC